MKKIIVAGLCMMMVLAGCAQPKQESTSDLEALKAKGTMVVGITEYAPMDYQDENGEWIGFDADLARIAAKDLGVEVEFLVIEWDNKFFELNDKKIDCIWNGMTICDEVLLNTKCSNAYAKNAQVLVMKKERLDEVKSEEDMKNIQIAVENGGSAMGLLEEMGITNYLAVYDQATAMMEVAAGKSDACVVDITMANALCAEGKSYADMGYVIELSKEEYGIGFRKDSDLCDAVNDLLNKYMEDGTMQQLSEKYDVALAE